MSGPSRDAPEPGADHRDEELLDRLRGGRAPVRAERARLGAAMRRLVATVVSTSADDATLAAATSEIERLAETLGSGVTRWPAGGGFGAGPGDDMFVTHPLVGAANPLAPPVDVDVVGNRIVAHATYGPAHEGLPGKVYGGVIATAFDGMAIFAAVLAGHRGVTGSLEVHFVRPTPIGVEVTYESEVTRVEGRKAFVSGRLFDSEDVLCVEATGVIVSVGPDVFDRGAES